jgi:hypothetical protein
MVWGIHKKGEGFGKVILSVFKGNRLRRLYMKATYLESRKNPVESREYMHSSSKTILQL